MAGPLQVDGCRLQDAAVEAVAAAPLNEETTLVDSVRDGYRWNWARELIQHVHVVQATCGAQQEYHVNPRATAMSRRLQVMKLTVLFAQPEYKLRFPNALFLTEVPILTALTHAPPINLDD